MGFRQQNLGSKTIWKASKTNISFSIHESDIFYSDKSANDTRPALNYHFYPSKSNTYIRYVTNMLVMHHAWIFAVIKYLNLWWPYEPKTWTNEKFRQGCALPGCVRWLKWSPRDSRALCLESILNATCLETSWTLLTPAAYLYIWRRLSQTCRN